LHVAREKQQKADYISLGIQLAFLSLTLFSSVAAAAMPATAALPRAAHTAGGSLAGLVSSPTGAPIAAAQITAVNQGTGASLSFSTNAAGRYRVNGLVPGNWVLRVQSPGYQLLQSAGWQVTTGHTHTQDFTLAPLTSSESPQSPGLLQQLLATRQDYGNIGQRGYRFAGRTLGSSTITYDGADATPIINANQQAFVRYAIPRGSFSDKRIVAALFSAETVAGPGGSRITTSRSGTQVWHGDFYFSPQANFFAAQSAFSSSKLPYSSTEYGGTIAGPLPRTGVRVFFAWLGLRQSNAQSLVGYVPSASLARQISSAWPSLRPILDAYPHGSIAVPNSNSTLQFRSTGNQNDDEDGGILRLDRDFGKPARSAINDPVFLRLNIDGATLNQPAASGGTYLTDRLQRISHPSSLVAGWSHGFSPALVGSLLFAAQRSTLETYSLDAVRMPYSIAVSGLTTLAGNQSTHNASNQFSFAATAAWLHGAHNLHFGLEMRRYQLNQGNTSAGTVSWASITDFTANRVSSATFANTLHGNGLRQTQLYTWAQDDWQLRPGLLLGLGLRYAVFQPMNEVHGWAIPFDFSSCGPLGFCNPGASFNQENFADFDPRVSIAWEPSFLPGWLGEHTLLRAGGGLYHSLGLLSSQNLPIQNEVKSYSLSSSITPNLRFPITPFLSSATGVASANSMYRHRADPYAGEWAVSAQEQFPYGFQATATWFGSLGQNLLNNSSLNLINPANHKRPHPDFGQISDRSDHGQSAYNALSLLAEHSFQRALTVMATYTWSHAIDNGVSGGGEADQPQNPACLHCERTSGDADIRQNFGGWGTYQLPWGSQRAIQLHNRWLSAVAGNWELQSAAIVRTGLPVNVTIDRSSLTTPTGYTISQRPDRVLGVSLTPPHGRTVQEWLNRDAFTTVHGLYGTTPRNVARGPSQWQIDFGAQRSFPLPRNFGLNARVYAANIFNHGQIGQPLSDWSTPQFGEIIAPATFSRTGSGAQRNLDFSLDLRY
jgi:hypothetical protein